MQTFWGQIVKRQKAQVKVKQNKHLQKQEEITQETQPEKEGTKRETSEKEQLLNKTLTFF